MGVPATKRFSIRRELGRGGMGVVYEAFDEERRAAVALKTLNRFDGDALARFKREFRTLQGLAHPNLVALDELFFERDQWFFTMELLDGVDFISHVRGAASAVALESTVRESVGKLAAGPLAVEDGAPGMRMGAFDEAKLRDGLHQLLEGLAALHASDRVHRDIKPSNVLVTREARVVLLDFGLVTEASGDERSTGAVIVGTPAYMAPEQAASRDVGPAADLYAVGVMLYEALTGRLPFDGSQLQILLDKQTNEAPRPSSIVAGVAPDLDTACMKLLRFDPASRPSARDLRGSLSSPRASGADLPRTTTEASTFVGRHAELAELRAAYDVSRTGRLASVLVCGESGIGKSYMVRRFTAQLLAERPDAVVLEGKCYERESVPYKTLDGIVDALSRRLSRMDAGEAAGVLPVRAAMLGQVFPAMLRVPQIAKEHATLNVTVEPHELRQRAFAALRELFERIAQRRPTAIVIDDLQWADDDGLRALAEILRPPDAPGLLLVGTIRVTPGNEEEALKRLRTAIPGDVRVLRVGHLGQEEARELAVTLLRRSDVTGADPALIASEAGGHPLFVEELARHVALGGSAQDSTSAPGTRRGPQTYVKLDGAIWSRIEQLEPATREMAELVAVAGNPIAQEVLAAAAHVEPMEFSRRTAALRVANIVRTGGARWADAIEPYHDRVREAVLAHLDPAAQAERHRALATAFEGTASRDSETLARHWLGAGNRTRAMRHTLDAADAAAAALAFDRAADLLERAIELGAAAGDDPRAVWEKLGDALANAGRGSPAAAAYQRAAEGAMAAKTLDLKRRAADQLLRSGQFDEGLSVIRLLLASIGVAMPETPLAALLMFLFWRMVVRLRGLGFRERDVSEVSPRVLTRIDVCWLMSFGLGMVDNIRGAAFQPRTLLLALRVGEPSRIALALATEVAYTSRAGTRTWQRSQRVLDQLRGFAERLPQHPLVRGWYHLVAGCRSHLAGKFAPAVPELDRALEVFRTRCVGSAWEVDTVELFALNAVAYLGHGKELRRRRTLYLRDAIDRGDRYAAVNFRVGYASFVWLIDDDADACLTDVRDAMSGWSKQGFHLEHYYSFQAEAQADLYAGRVAEAHAHVIGQWGAFQRSLLWTIQFAGIATCNLRARTAIALAEDAKPGDRGPLLAMAERDARAIEKRKTKWGDALALLLRAGTAAVERVDDRAVGLLRSAASRLEEEAMGFHAAAARRALGKMVGGDEGRTMVVAAETAMASEGVVSPARMTAMLMPGFRERE